MARIRLPVALVSRRYGQNQTSRGVGEQEPQISAQGEQACMGNMKDAQKTVDQGQSHCGNRIHTAVDETLNE